MANSDKFVSNIALIDTVKDCPLLWDSKSETFLFNKDVEKKKAKWTKLVQKFGVSAGVLFCLTHNTNTWKRLLSVE